MTERTVKTSLIAQADQYIREFIRASEATKKTRTEIEALQAKGRAFQELGQGALIMGATAAAGLALAASKFADFDQAMSNVAAATQESASNMALLREAAVDAGGETSFSASEAAQAIEELGKAGLTTGDILEGGLSGALDLAAAGQLDVARAAEITAITLKQFGLQGDRATDVADMLAAGAGKAAGDVEDLAQALNQSALVAAQTGLSVEETTGVLSAFASAGLLGSDAGTSLRTALQRLTPQSKEAEEEMRRLGISAFDAQGRFIGAADLAGELEEGLADLTDEQRNASLAIIFGSDAVRAASVLYEEGADGIAEWIEKTNDSGFAARVAADRLDNLNGDLEKLGGAFDTAVIQSGGAANDVLRELVQGATFLVDAVGDLPTPVLEGATAIGTAGTALLLTSGAALTGIPRIVEFKNSIRELGVTGRGAVAGIGAAGLAIGAATYLLTEFVAKQAQLAGQANALADSFDKTTGAFTDYSRELVIANLQAEGAFEQAERLGLSQAELVDVILEGGEAWKTLDERMTAADADARFLKETKEDLTDTAREQAGVVDDARKAWENEQAAMEGASTASDDATAATDRASAALEDAAAAAENAEQAVIDLAAAMSDFGNAELDARSAVRQMESAIDAATASFEEHGATLDRNTEAGLANEEALDAIAAAANDAAGAIYTQTGSIDDASAALARGREEYIRVGEQMGLTREQAEAYADALIATPKFVETQAILTGIKQVETELLDFITRANGSRINITAGFVQRPGQFIANADGGMYSYADGGFGEGMYSGGTPLYKFAEPETRWEAFISGREGMEERNRAVWAEAGQRLGVLPAVGGPTTVSLEGAQLSLDVDGRQIRAVIREQVVAVDQEWQQEVRSGRRR